MLIALVLVSGCDAQVSVSAPRHLGEVVDITVVRAHGFFGGAVTSIRTTKGQYQVDGYVSVGPGDEAYREVNRFGVPFVCIYGPNDARNCMNLIGG